MPVISAKAGKQLGLHPRAVVYMLCDQFQLACTVSARQCHARLAGLARHPGDALVRACRGVPLPAQGWSGPVAPPGEATAPSGSSGVACPPLSSGGPVRGRQQARPAAKPGRGGGNGQQYGVETAKARCRRRPGAYRHCFLWMRVALDTDRAATQFTWSCTRAGPSGRAVRMPRGNQCRFRRGGRPGAACTRARGARSWRSRPADTGRFGARQSASRTVKY